MTMNDIINWITLNNSLMIKIGFSAVVLLLAVYVFRFFFMPSISVVENAVKSESPKPNSDMNIEELAELQAEVDTLKAKLKELQKGEQKTAAAQAATASAGLETVTPAAPATQDADPSAAKELKEKIRVLESRLSEYEIIAEEIAEIGKLKQENEDLKQKLKAAPEKNTEVAATPTVEDPTLEEPLGNPSDQEIDDLLGAALESAPQEPVSAETVGSVSAEEEDKIEVNGALEAETSEDVSGTAGVQEDAPEQKVGSAALAPEKAELFILHSDVEVTEEEKELINSFEDYKKV
jgi:DNA repair exonuclease SbcCD ATPase subunit